MESKEIKDRNQTEIVVLLDRSGSMASIGQATVEGFNTFLNEQKNAEGEAFMTLVQFDDRYEMNYQSLPVKDATPLILGENFIPRGSTALIDAIGKTIDELNEKLNEAYKQNELLSEKLKVNETAILLEKKTKGMPVAKKEFITNLLNDKDASYINENFNYVVEMFERGEEEKSSELVEEAKRGAVSKNVKIPAQTAVIAESKTEKVDGSPVNGYLTELQRF